MPASGSSSLCVIVLVSCLLGCQMLTSSDTVAHYSGINLYLGDDRYIEAFISPAKLNDDDAASLELRSGTHNLGLIAECDEDAVSKFPGTRLIRVKPNSGEEIAYENAGTEFYFDAGKLRKVHIESWDKWSIYDRRKKISVSMPAKKTDIEHMLGEPVEWSHHKTSRP